MRMYLISDNIDTLAGMRLAGVDGVVVHDAETLKQTVNRLLVQDDLGILIFTEKAAGLDTEYVRNLKVTLHTPIVVEIPDRHGRRDIADSINDLVQDSIGLKL